MQKKAHRDLSDKMIATFGTTQVADLMIWTANQIEAGNLNTTGMKFAAQNAKIAINRENEAKAASLLEQAKLDVARLTQYS